MKVLFFSLLILILYPYIIYFIILEILQLFTKKSEYITDDKFFPKVSIIVPAYNEEFVIKKKIENLLKLDWPKNKIEHIVISDGSNDKTPVIIKKFKTIKPIILKSRIGKAQILNRYIPKAKGDIIILTDANTLFKSDTVKNIVKYFSSPKTGVVCGKLLFSGMKEETKYWNFENILKRVESKIGGLFNANGGIYAIRKEYFKKIPDDTIVDDIAIPLKIDEQGYKILYAEDAVAFEQTSEKWKDEIRRRIRIGYGNLQLLYFWIKGIIRIKGIKIFTFISHKIIRWMIPLFLILIFFTNIVLLSERLFFFTFVVQVFIYLNSLFLKNIFSYFVKINFALLIGYVRFVFGKGENIWA